MPGHHPQGADLLGFLEQALRRADQPEPAPILDPEGYKYHAHWERGWPLYHKASVTVHAHPNLGVDGRLGAYECVGPGWQLNVLLTHARFGEETKVFLDTPSLAYRRLSLLAPTIIIGDLNAASTDDDRTGPPTATDTAVRDAMHQLGLTNLTAGLTGTPSHYPHQAGTHPSRIDTCYGDPTTVRVHEAAYGDLPPTGTGHRPLYIDLIIPNLPPPAATLPETPSHSYCSSRPRTTTAPGTGITGPYTPSCGARVHRHSPPPCAGRHKHAAWSVTPTTWEHHQTSPSSNSSMTSGPQKGNSPPCYAPAHRRHETGTLTSVRSSPPAATNSRNGRPTA